MNPDFDLLTQRATHILKNLIAIPSTSRNETEAADFLFNYLTQEGAEPQRYGNNVWTTYGKEQQGHYLPQQQTYPTA